MMEIGVRVEISPGVPVRPQDYGQLVCLACLLHVGSLLSCVAVVYLYLTTNTRRRTRLAKMLLFLALSGALLAVITAIIEWNTYEACLGEHQCRRQPTPIMSILESSKIVGLHGCHAWTACIAIHLVLEQLSAQGLSPYNFRRMQRVYHCMGWGAPLIHMQFCIALKSSVSPIAAKMTFIAFDIMTALFVLIALLHTLVAKVFPPLCSLTNYSPTQNHTSTGMGHGGGGGGTGALVGALPGLLSGPRAAAGETDCHWSTVLGLMPYVIAHGWKLPFNLVGSFHLNIPLFSPSLPYVMARELLPGVHGIVLLACYIVLFSSLRRDNPLF